MSTFRRSLVVATLAVGIGAGSAAHATSFSATELSYDNALLSQFNLVALSSWQSSGSSIVTVDGRVITNSVAFSNTAGTGACVASGCGNATKAVDGTNALYGALTVFNNYTGVGGVATAGATSYIGGTASGTFYMGDKGTLDIKGTSSGLTVDHPGTVNTAQSAANSPSFTNNTAGVKNTGVSAATVFPFSTINSLSGDVKALAAGIALLPGSPGVSAQALPSGNNIFFTANNDYTNGGKKYGVITTTLANLASGTGAGGINNNGNDATFVIVTGDGANYTLPSLSSYAGSNKVIYDFVDATTLKFGGSWSGSILAPLATITSMVGTIDGSVIVNSINQSQALYSTNLFAGDLSGLVPEPSSLAVIGVGIAALALVRRRRK